MTPTPRSYRAVVPLDQLARGLMDQGYSLAARTDVHHEYSRLIRGESEITVFNCGCIRAEDAIAAKVLAGVCRGAK
jgi:hypothetical protein